MPTISVTPVSSVEGASYVDFIVTLSEPAPFGATVDYRIRSGTADMGVDFNYPLSTYRVTFAPGETSITIRVNDSHDTAVETDESIFVELFDPVGAELPDGLPVLSATAFILDNDGVGSDLAMQVSNPVVIEADGAGRVAVFEITLSEPAPSALSLAYTTANGTAVSGGDFAARSGLINFVAGQTSAFVSVPIIGDNLDEASETFFLVVTPTPAIANGVAGAVGTGTILNDDAAGGQLTISVSPASSVEGANYVRFIVQLSGPNPNGVSVNYRTISGTAATGTDFLSATGTLVFAPGQTTREILVNDRPDTLAETDESLFLELFNPSNAVLSGGVPALRATGFILDNDAVGSDLAMQVSRPVIAESISGTRQAVFEIRLSEPAPAGLAMNFTTVNGTAVAGTDFVARSGTVNFAPGQTSAYVTVQVFGDTVFEGAQSFGLSVQPAAVIANGTAGAVGQATVLDADLSGNDRIDGTARSEVLNGGGGQDTLTGFAGNDTISAGTGNDLLRGDAGLDSLKGETGNDTIHGGLDNDRLFGGAGTDSLSGDAGGDVLFGDGGTDLLYGGAGNDRLFGRAGDDTLFGGSGADAFVFDRAVDPATNVDRIQDFSGAAGDRIRLDDDIFTAVGGSLGSGEFRLGTAALDANDFLIYDRPTGRLWYDADGAGGAAKQLMAVLDAGTLLGLGNFEIQI